MRRYTTVVHPEGRELRIQSSGLDDWEVYQVGDTVKWEKGVVPGTGKLLDGAYWSVSDARPDMDSFVLIKNHKIEQLIHPYAKDGDLVIPLTKGAIEHAADIEPYDHEWWTADEWRQHDIRECTRRLESVSRTLRKAARTKGMDHHNTRKIALIMVGEIAGDMLISRIKQPGFFERMLRPESLPPPPTPTEEFGKALNDLSDAAHLYGASEESGVPVEEPQLKIDGVYKNSLQKAFRSAGAFDFPLKTDLSNMQVNDPSEDK